MMAGPPKIWQQKIAAGLMAQPQRPNSFFYPQGWSGGLFGLGNAAIDAATVQNKFSEQFKRSHTMNDKKKAILNALTDSANNPIVTGFSGPTALGSIKSASATTSAAKKLLAERSVFNVADDFAKALRDAFPSLRVETKHWPSQVGNSSYIEVYGKESADDLANKMSEWIAAKGTKRGPPPGQKFISQSIRVSDHSVGPKRYLEHFGHLTPQSTAEEMDKIIERILAVAPWLR